MDHIQELIIKAIDEHKDEIIAIGRDIFANPELGYKEYRTSKKFSDFMNQFGIETEKNLAVTGAKGYLKEKKEDDITIAVIGELDALPIADGPHSCNGASHACGHNAQMAAMMGSAFALCLPEVKEALHGNVVFFAVPAEEFVENDFKKSLMDKGIIKYGGGKCELLRIGAFDDINIALGHHTGYQVDICAANNRSNGFVNKLVKFKGQSAHAAGSPHTGLDALNASHIAYTAVLAQQESYRDEDSVRVHGFITHGGEAVNIIADNISMEYSVRANNIPALENVNERVDRCFKAGALATGCGVEITTMPGYLPTIPSPDMSAVKDAIALVSEGYTVTETTADKVTGGSTDFGDVSQLMPVMQFNTGGYTDPLHDKCNHPENEELAYVTAAKIFALSTYNLLKDDAKKAKELLAQYKPSLTKEEYIAYMDAHDTTEVVEKTLLKHTVA